MVRPSQVMAPAGHFDTHLRHSVQPTMQVARTTDCLSFATHDSSMRRCAGTSSNRSLGQTGTQTPQPVHSSGSTSAMPLAAQGQRVERAGAHAVAQARGSRSCTPWARRTPARRRRTSRRRRTRASSRRVGAGAVAAHDHDAVQHVAQLLAGELGHRASRPPPRPGAQRLGDTSRALHHRLGVGLAAGEAAGAAVRRRQPRRAPRSTSGFTGTWKRRGRRGQREAEHQPEHGEDREAPERGARASCGFMASSPPTGGSPGPRSP